jgi:Excreted virulence factor EspC, type VII ESX diderm
MADKIVVDPAWVRQHAQVMNRIKGVIDDSALAGVADHYAGSMGSGTVAGKLSDVMSNWTQERAKLSDQLGKLGQFADTTARSFERLDQGYADALNGRKTS